MTTFGPGGSSWRSAQHEVDVETGLRAGRRREPAVVRPAPPGRDERVGALCQRRADEEFEVAQLVATERQREQVLALDPDVDLAAQRGRKPGEPLQRRRPVDQRETRQRGDAGRNLIDRHRRMVAVPPLGHSAATIGGWRRG